MYLTKDLFGEYLDYENCKCRKKLVDKLVAECTENIDEVKTAEINSTENVCVCLCYLGCNSLSNQHWN